MFVIPLFSQTTYKTYDVETSVISSAKMIKNYSEDKWDFVPTDKFDNFKCLWVFYISNENTGTITNGSINYDILDYKQIDEKTIKISVYNLKVGRNMDLLIIKGEDSISIGVFDYTQRTAYYFLP
jgi:hypothetical protein